MEEISLSITKFNIHAVIIIGGFEVSSKTEILLVGWYSQCNMHILGVTSSLMYGKKPNPET